MRRFGLAVALVLSPLAATAQATDETCEAGLEALVNFLPVELEFTRRPGLSDGLCEAVGLRFPDLDMLVVEIDRLTWAPEGPSRLFAEGQPPDALLVQAEGVRAYAETGMVALDYAMRLQAQTVAMRFGMDLRWDEDTREVAVNRLAWSDGRGNRLTVSGRVAEVDLTDWSRLSQSIGQAGVAELDIEIQSADLVESYLAMPFADVLLTEDAPAAQQVATLKAQAVAVVEAVPEAVLAGEDRAALVALVDALPRPRGQLDLRIEADPLLGMPRFLRFALSGPPQTPDDLWPALEGVTLDAEWRPGLPD